MMAFAALAEVAVAEIPSFAVVVAQEILTDTTKLQLPINCVLMGQQDQKRGETIFDNKETKIKSKITLSAVGEAKISGSSTFTVSTNNRGYD